MVPVLSLFFLVSLVAAAPRQTMQVHESRARVPAGFEVAGKPHGDTQLKLRFGLKQRNVEGLVEALYRVSNPSSPDYGNHLSQDEVNTFTSPTPKTLAAVTAWLSSNGITASPATPAGEWLELSLSVSEADALFDADFTLFTHPESGTHGIRTMQYSLPADLRDDIKVLYPGISFWSAKSAPKLVGYYRNNATLDKRQLPPCNQLILPTCLQQFYGIPATPATQKSNTIGVTGLIGQFANKVDLTTFLRNFRPDIADSTFSVQSVDGGQNPQTPSSAGIEAALDEQYTVGVASRVPNTFFSVGQTNADPIQDLVDTLLAGKARPQVLSTSYGGNEVFFSPAAADLLCTGFASLGAQGTSVIFSSGDGGVAGTQPSNCTKFVPTYPSVCPFVTSVGGTTGAPPEQAASFSSGGFSAHFPIPDYQAAVVQAYIAQLGGKFNGLFNAQGRAYPDVAAAATNFGIVVGGKFGSVDGTSASTPVFASIVALINDRRAAAGKPPLGFLNPFLYSNPQAFTDVTVGSNPGCGTNGFPTTPGWDPVTGLGTPKFDALAAAAGV